MPTAKEKKIIEQIVKINPDADTSGKNEAELTAMLQELAAKQANPEYKVAAGKSLSTRRGIKGPGATITAEMVNGEETLKDLKDKGYIE